MLSTGCCCAYIRFGRLNVVYVFRCMVYVYGRRVEGVGDKGDQV